MKVIGTKVLGYLSSRPSSQTAFWVSLGEQFLASVTHFSTCDQQSIDRAVKFLPVASFHDPKNLSGLLNKPCIMWILAVYKHSLQLFTNTVYKHYFREIFGTDYWKHDYAVVFHCTLTIQSNFAKAGAILPPGSTGLLQARSRYTLNASAQNKQMYCVFSGSDKEHST